MIFHSISALCDCRWHAHSFRRQHRKETPKRDVETQAPRAPSLTRIRPPQQTRDAASLALCCVALALYFLRTHTHTHRDRERDRPEYARAQHSTVVTLLRPQCDSRRGARGTAQLRQYLARLLAFTLLECAYGTLKVCVERPLQQRHRSPLRARRCRGGRGCRRIRPGGRHRL